MNQSSTELKVGIFAILVIIVLTYMTFKVGSLPMLWEKGYRLYVDFDDINGLDEQSRIKVAGVEVGIVEKINLEGGKARITLVFNPDVEVYSDAVASPRMSGLLGDKYLSILTGSPDQPLLQAGDVIRSTRPAADIDMLANQLTNAATYIGDLTASLQDIFGQGERTAIKEAIKNLNTVTINLRGISEENREPLRNLIVQLESFTEALNSKGPGVMDDISVMAKNLGEKGPELMENLNRVAMELDQILAENKTAFKDSMENLRETSESASNITRKLDAGEGTLGRLLQEDELYESLTKVSTEAGKSLDVIGRLRTFLDFHTEYNTEEGEWKGYFDLTLQPKKDTYYILGVVSDPMGSVDTTERTTNGVTVIEEEVEEEIEFTAQYAKRFDDFALRIGLMENTFGFGADYFFSDDTGRLKFDIWDFDAKEARADDAHVRIGVDYKIFKFLFVSGGVDNLLNSNRRGIYVGGGMKFEDKDFKYIFGSTPGIPVK
jgi:phospholipid/cholesterol/gamma-HCH transport system substrate-binding protein